MKRAPKTATAKRAGKNGAGEPISELGRRLRRIKKQIAASGEYLFQTDDEVLEEVRPRRAGILADSAAAGCATIW